MHRSTPEDEFAQTWFDYGRSVFPQSVRKTGTNVELCNVPTYQCSILFSNMGWFNRKCEVRKPQNLNKPVAKGGSSMSPICHYSENSGETTTRMCFWQRKLTAYRQTQNSCLRTVALVGCHSSRSNDLSVHARIGSRRYVRLLLESSEEDDKNSHAAIFEVKIGEKNSKRTESRERTTDTLFNDLESV